MGAARIPQHRLAWGPVLAVAAALVVVLLATSPRYGYHRDDLYFLEAAQHLAWGYVDQPPLVPVVARVSTALFGEAAWALRVAPAVAMGLTAVVAALLARELGGTRGAQVLAAAAVGFSGYVLGAGHLISTSTFDFAFWMVLLWIAARILRTGDTRLWLAFGGVAGVALYAKHLPALLALSLAVGLVADGRWALLRSPWLPAGGALAVLLALPTLVWQASNGWPQAELAEAIADRIGGENRALLVPGQIVFLGPLLLPMLVAGVRRLGWRDDGRPFRPLLWAWLVALVLVLVAAGRPYYPLALAATMVVAGVVAFAESGRRRTAAWLIAANAAFTVPIALPVLPIDWVDDAFILEVNETAVEQIGWPELADQVAAVVADLPPEEREGVVLLTATYGEAGALDRFGPERGLPEPYSGHNAYWHWRRPTDDEATVVAVRYERETLEPHFARCDEVATVDNGRGVENEVQGTPIHVCRGLRGTWDGVWPQLERIS